MNKAEAIQAMKDGKKVTHRFFSKDEWMTMVGNRIILEDGVECWAHEFWADRKGHDWDNDYSLYNN
jgi:hypothetical protein